jgi:hypothetical protein
MRKPLPLNQLELQKLDQLNKHLTGEEQRIYQDFLVLMSKHKADDVLYQIKVLGFKNKEDEEPFFEIIQMFCFMIFQLNEHKKYTSTYTQQDFTEFEEMRTAAFLPHCYTFHDLYDHHHLTLKDLLNTKEIWLELEMTFQYISSFKKVK